MCLPRSLPVICAHTSRIIRDLRHRTKRLAFKAKDKNEENRPALDVSLLCSHLHLPPWYNLTFNVPRWTGAQISLNLNRYFDMPCLFLCVLVSVGVNELIFLHYSSSCGTVGSWKNHPLFHCLSFGHVLFLFIYRVLFCHINFFIVVDYI